MKSVQTGKKLVALVVALFILGINSNVFAYKGDKPNTQLPISVKVIGSLNGHNLLQLEIDNVDGEEVEISFRDIDGVELFNEVFTDKKISKKFLFDICDADFKHIQMTVNSRKVVTEQVYYVAKSLAANTK